jgi:hypothetical protein
MNVTTQELLERALALDEHERTDLADELLANLGPKLHDMDQEAWLQELRRRADEMRSGAMKSSPALEILERLSRRPCEKA